MREIKFRAWDKANKQMIYPVNLIPQNGEFKGEQYEQVVPAWSFGETNERVFMQYTGLKDKNGKEIYEGDILGGILQSVVIWIEKWARFGFCFAEELNEVRFEDLEQNELEVIGNIYENVWIY